MAQRREWPLPELERPLIDQPRDPGDAVLLRPSRERRRLVLRSVLRIAATTLGLLALYAFVPIPGRSGLGATIGMVIGLLIFTGLTGWQLRRVVRSDQPVLQAIEAVAFALSLLLAVFAFTYLTLSRADPGNFSEHLDRVDAMYFTVSTLATVGFGDISPISDGARLLVTVQMLFDLVLIAGLVRLVVLATRAGLRRQAGGAGEPAP